jgi:hypothetical protein
MQPLVALRGAVGEPPFFPAPIVFFGAVQAAASNRFDNAGISLEYFSINWRL